MLKIVDMHIVYSKFKSRGKTYVQTLLRTSYREGGKVKKRTIANLTDWPEEDLTAFKFALKHKKNLGAATASLSVPDNFDISSGKSVGSVWTIYQVAKKLGIEKALGSHWQGRLAFWQIIARVQDQGSRLSAVRLGETHAIADVLKFERGFDENNLYDNLHWIAENQSSIEQKLFNRKARKPSLFLYDVTSSYLEGTKNELADWGYNRDKKKGKKQIVIGMLTDEDGDPLSTQVFKGNTQDTTTFVPQVYKVARLFGCKTVTFVGDRGMIKKAQIEAINKCNFHYITSITKPQIEKLIKDGVFTCDQFDEQICEIIQDGLRYVLKRNPIRAEENRLAREDKKRSVQRMVNERLEYLKQHPKASRDKALKVVIQKIKRLKIDNWLSIAPKDWELCVDEETLAEESRLDGCYVIKSDLPDVAAQTIHDRYKDLAYVEWAFRTCKSDLELRPIFVRSEESTYGHVVVVMLAYMIIRAIDKAWQKLYLTTREGLNGLAGISLTEICIGDKAAYQMIPRPTGRNKRMLDALGLELPPVLVKSRARVVTKKARRKQAVGA
jgi:hypothetical protein